MIYTIQITTDEHLHYEHSYFGTAAAIDFGIQCGLCDNVEAVDIISQQTGEIILSMEQHKVTWTRDPDHLMLDIG